LISAVAVGPGGYLIAVKLFTSHQIDLRQCVLVKKYQIDREALTWIKSQGEPKLFFLT
jgi:hypothetical protein